MTIVSTTLTANAQGTIGDALRSVVDWVDACLVIDTGVSDQTLDEARTVAGDKLLVRQLPWTNDFAAARNYALEAAQAAGAEWAVTVDTDERLVLDGLDIRSALASQSAGVLLVESETRDYAKERFFRLPTPARWSGPTHEALLGTSAVGTATLPSIRFRELPKDAVKLRHKLERDVAILERHTQQHPHDPRWHFYLGESHRNLRRFPEAIAAYEACAALRGWDEESAWACYQAAQCHLELGAHQHAIDRCAAGLIRHAGFAELPWLAAVASHRLGNYAQAVYWARLAITWGWYRGDGRSIPRMSFRHLPGLYEGPYDVLRFALEEKGDHAEAKEAEYHYHLARAARLRFEAEPGAEADVEHDLAVTIHSYYVGRHDDGLQACERLLDRPITSSQEGLVRRNRTWYTKALDALVSTRFVRLNVEPAHPSWSLFNPTILVHGDAWLALVRSSNYRHVGDGYAIPAEDSVFKSEYILVELSASLTIERTRICSGPTYSHSGYLVTGLEDCRLYSAPDGLHISATIRDHLGSHGLCRIATARLDPTSATLSDLRLLEAPGNLHEKNWMPILGEGRWLYHCSHRGRTATIEPVIIDGKEQCRLELRSPSPRIASHFRGSSQLVPVGGGWIALIHEVVVDDDRRIYNHRFVRFDDDFAIASYSVPFYFRESRTVEFAAGLAANGSRLVATFGVRDAESWLVELELDEVLALTTCG